MNGLFLIDKKDLKRELMKIEPEMLEDCYSDENIDQARVSEVAHKIIYHVFVYIKLFYKESKQTVPNLIAEIYRIAATGEYSHLQSPDDIKNEWKLFELMKGKAGFNETIYAIRLLRYYYAVREKEYFPQSEWRRIERIYKSAIRLQIEGLINKKPEADSAPAEISEDEFLFAFYDHMNKYYMGHDCLKKKICTTITKWVYHDERTITLIIGPSGCGKNYLMKILSSFPYLKYPVVTYDCTNLTPVGFTGDDVTAIYKKLEAAQGKLNPVGPGAINSSKRILYLDEADKIINFNHDSHGESVNAMVQQQLLTLLAGTEKYRAVDSGQILIILGGTFSKIDDLLKEKERNSIGFTHSKSTVFDFKSSIRENLLAIGGEKEFVGRIKDIIKLEPLTKEDLRAILLDENIGELTKIKKFYEESGLTLDIDDDMVDEMVEQIVKQNAGARSISNIISEFADNRYYFEMKYSGFDTMRIHKGMLTGEKPIFSKSNKEGELAV